MGDKKRKKEKVSIWVLETWSCATQFILSLSRRSVWPCLKQTVLWRESSPNIRQISLHGATQEAKTVTRSTTHLSALTLTVKTLHTCREGEDGCSCCLLDNLHNADLMLLHNESIVYLNWLCGGNYKEKTSLKAITEDQGDIGVSAASLTPRERTDSDWTDDGAFSGFTQPEGQLFTSSPWGRQKNKLRVRV